MSHWVIDEISGQKISSDDAVKNWKGQIVHTRNYEPRHPQDTIKLPAENPSVKDPRPRGTDRYPTITADDL